MQRPGPLRPAIRCFQGVGPAQTSYLPIHAQACSNRFSIMTTAEGIQFAWAASVISCSNGVGEVQKRQAVLKEKRMMRCQIVYVCPHGYISQAFRQILPLLTRLYPPNLSKGGPNIVPTPFKSKSGENEHPEMGKAASREHRGGIFCNVQHHQRRRMLPHTHLPLGLVLIAYPPRCAPS